MPYKVKKRRKSSRYRASQTARRGKKARTRGSGNQGGKGWSGTGKRGDQKKTLVINMTGGNNYFGKDKALRRGRKAKKLEVINLSAIEVKSVSLKSKDGFISLENYKILGEGELVSKLKIRASAASAEAMAKVKKAGGEIILDLMEFEEAPAKKAEPEKKAKVSKK